MAVGRRRALSSACSAEWTPVSRRRRPCVYVQLESWLYRYVTTRRKTKGSTDVHAVDANNGRGTIQRTYSMASMLVHMDVQGLTEFMLIGAFNQHEV
jgi:hypothetical protein